MANPDGAPIWYELITSDPDASKKFYDEVVGWTTEPQASGDIDYRMITAPDGVNVGGVMPLHANMLANGAKPGWLFYIGVQDVDGTAEKIKQLGGSIHVGPMDIPDVGRFALIADALVLLFHRAVDRCGQGADRNSWRCSYSGAARGPRRYIHIARHRPAGCRLRVGRRQVRRRYG